MVHLSTLEEQREFYERNIVTLLKEYFEGFVVYYNDPHNYYHYYRTEEELKAIHPTLNRFTKEVRFCTEPLVIDMTAEQFERKTKHPTITH